MNETVNEQTEATAAVESVNENLKETSNETAGEATVSLGKFKDVNALLAAYNSLQSEFTKRCQRVKELEANISAAVDKATPTENSANTENRNSGITEEDKDNFIKGYLKEIMSAKSKAIVMDVSGTGIKTPANKPTTVEEAGRLAKELLAK